MNQGRVAERVLAEPEIDWYRWLVDNELPLPVRDYQTGEFKCGDCTYRTDRLVEIVEHIRSYHNIKPRMVTADESAVLSSESASP